MAIVVGMGVAHCVCNLFAVVWLQYLSAALFGLTRTLQVRCRAPL
jgi:hypothetical protein